LRGAMLMNFLIRAFRGSEQEIYIAGESNYEDNLH
jgi:hypothetical protein